MTSTQSEWLEVKDLMDRCNDMFAGKDAAVVFNVLCNLLGQTLSQSSDPPFMLGVTMIVLSQYLVSNCPGVSQSYSQKRSSQIEREAKDDQSIN